MIPYQPLTAWNILGLEVQVWGIFAALGFLVGTNVLEHTLPPPRHGSAGFFSVIVFVAGMVGAKLAYSLSQVGNPNSIASLVSSDGFGFIGGLLGGGAMALFLVKRWRWALPSTLDALALATAAAYTIGRIGCFLIHDHIGKATSVPWGILIDGKTFHETSLYGFLNGLILFVVLGILTIKRVRPGIVTLVFVIQYLLVRFLIEFFQAGPYIAGLTYTQLVIIALLCVGALTVRWWPKRLLHRP